MRDVDCVAFLRWALPRLRMRWPGFRRVRRQVCKRIDRRLRALGLADARAYRTHLETHPAEWGVLDGLCRITISRFYRDRAVFDALRDEVLPRLSACGRTRVLHCWSAGCGSGEEAYTLAILWKLCLAARFPDVRLRVTATDLDAVVLTRARSGTFSASALRELPAAWRERAFVEAAEGWRVRPEFRDAIEFRHEDIRVPQTSAADRFQLVLCRNLVFTYFELELQREILDRIAARMVPGGALVLGIHETLPPDTAGFAPWHAKNRIYRRSSAGAAHGVDAP
jgi:chemotaxis protein methyltransferase CheR